MDILWTILHPWGFVAAALAGMAVSFLASAVETGAYRLNRVRLNLRAGQGDRRAALLVRLLGDLRGLIVTILIVNNAANFVTAGAVTALVADALAGAGDLAVQLAATAIVTPLLFVFCELLPKNVFIHGPEREMAALARGTHALYAALRGLGLVPALKGLSNLVLRLARRWAEPSDPFTPRQRLRAILQESAADGVISGYQGELLGKVLTLRERAVGEVMIPLGRVAAVPVDIDRERFIDELRRHSFSRLPVWESRRENVIGLVRINDVLARGDAPFDLRAVLLRDVPVASPDLPVGQALARLRRARAAMALVRDSRGHTIGIVTIKDLVEEIVGELAAW